MQKNEDRIRELKETEYQVIFGVQKQTFEKMLSILEAAYKKLHAQGGKPATLSVLDKLVITLCYLREYRTWRHIAFDYGVKKSAIGNSIHWVEDTLLADGTFSLPSKRAYEKEDAEVEVLVVDVTEQAIERPKRGRKNGIQERNNSIL